MIDFRNKIMAGVKKSKSKSKKVKMLKKKKASFSPREKHLPFNDSKGYYIEDTLVDIPGFELYDGIVAVTKGNLFRTPGQEYRHEPPQEGFSAQNDLEGVEVDYDASKIIKLKNENGYSGTLEHALSSGEATLVNDPVEKKKVCDKFFNIFKEAIYNNEERKMSDNFNTPIEHEEWMD